MKSKTPGLGKAAGGPKTIEIDSVGKADCYRLEIIRGNRHFSIFLGHGDHAVDLVPRRFQMEPSASVGGAVPIVAPAQEAAGSNPSVTSCSTRMVFAGGQSTAYWAICVNSSCTMPGFHFRTVCAMRRETRANRIFHDLRPAGGGQQVCTERFTQAPLRSKVQATQPGLRPFRRERNQDLVEILCGTTH